MRVIYVDDNDRTCEALVNELKGPDTEVTRVNQISNSFAGSPETEERPTEDVLQEIREAGGDLILLDMFKQSEKRERQEELFGKTRLDLVREGTGLQSEELVRALRQSSRIPIIVVSDELPTDALESHFSRSGADWVLHKSSGVSLRTFVLSFMKRLEQPRVVALIEDESTYRAVTENLLTSRGLELIYPTLLDGEQELDLETAWEFLLTNQGGYHVVLVDLLLLASELGQQVYRDVARATDDKAVLETIEDIPEHLRGGIELLHRRQHHDRMKAVPFIVLSNFVPTRQTRRALRFLGATDVFLKEEVLATNGQAREEFIGLLRLEPEDLLSV